MADVAHQFEYTATGVLGDKRDTMLGNQLLLRSELGRPMRRGYTSYPGDVYRYGKPNPENNGGASAALGCWPASGVHFPNRASGLDGDVSKSAMGIPDRDFMALNREAVKKGLVTAGQQYQFRATHDIRKKVQSEADAGPGGAGGGRSGARRLPPSMVFGISTRPSTPIHDLLEHRYQDRWLAEQRSADMAQRQQQSQAQNVRMGKVNETRASMMRIHQVPVQSAPLWKMPRFSKNACPSIETFRSDGVKNIAYTNASSDRIGREGMYGTGACVSAVN